MKKVYILATGGTISAAGCEGKTTGYHDGKFELKDLLARVKGAEKLAKLEGEQVLNISSDDITWGDWLSLAGKIEKLSLRSDMDGFVVTHGTNTLEETAYFLNLVLKTEKPVVLTGSMRPATANSADGPQNLYEAIALAASEDAKGKGVLAAFSDLILSADRIQKVNCFRTDAFSGRDFGCIGYMQDSVPKFLQYPVENHTTHTRFTTEALKRIPRVEIAYFSADADPEILEFYGKTAEGLVIAGAGSGLFSKPWKEKIRGIAREIPVVRSSRVGNGMVSQDYCDEELGTIPGGTLTPVKARILLTLALAMGAGQGEIGEIFKQY